MHLNTTNAGGVCSCLLRLSVTLQRLLGSVQLLLLLGQLHAKLGGGEHVGRAASLGLLQVFAQHVLHLPQQAHLLLELGHLLAQQHCNHKSARSADVDPKVTLRVARPVVPFPGGFAAA